MKKNAKQKLADLKSQSSSNDELMRKLAQWDEHGEMPVEVQEQITGGVAISKIPIVVLGIWFPVDPTF